MCLKSSISVLAATISIAILAGCGAGDDSSTNAAQSNDSSRSTSADRISTSSLSKAELLKRDNATCHRLRGDRVRALHHSSDDHPRDGETRQEYWVRVIRLLSIPTLEAQTREVRKLGAPRGDEQQLDEILVAYEDAAGLAAKLKTLKDIAPINQGFKEASLAAKKYGLDECVVYQVGLPG